MRLPDRGSVARPEHDGWRRSRWAAVFSGIWMLAILLIFSELVGEVAMATLAAVLIYAGWGTIKPRELWSVADAGAIPAIAMTATFLSVLLLPVATAVGVGVVASLLMQLNQESLDLRLERLRIDAEDRLVEDGGDPAARRSYGASCTSRASTTGSCSGGTTTG